MTGADELRAELSEAIHLRDYFSGVLARNHAELCRLLKLDADVANDEDVFNSLAQLLSDRDLARTQAEEARAELERVRYAARQLGLAMQEGLEQLLSHTPQLLKVTEPPPMNWLKLTPTEGNREESNDDRR